MITGAQVRAARGLLGCTMRELAHRAVVSIAMVDFVEETQGPSSGSFAHLAAIQAILEAAGIEFVETSPNENRLQSGNGTQAKATGTPED
jgi:transcriptional regulator with XRE-family HTH domain